MLFHLLLEITNIYFFQAVPVAISIPTSCVRPVIDTGRITRHVLTQKSPGRREVFLMVGYLDYFDKSVGGGGELEN